MARRALEVDSYRIVQPRWTFDANSVPDSESVATAGRSRQYGVMNEIPVPRTPSPATISRTNPIR